MYQHSFKVPLTASIVFSVLLSACGGGGGSSDPAPTPDPDPTPTSFTVGGMISGNIEPIALSLNGNAQSFTGGGFAFTAELDDGGAYEVLFVSGGANEVCTVDNGSGTVSAADVTDIDVTCEQVSDMSILQYDNSAILGALSAGDFNGDGTQDLAFLMRTLDGHPLGNNIDLVRFAFGNGLGSFASVFDEQTICKRATKRGRELLSLDIDADGFDDLVCTGADTGIEIFMGANEPASGFTSGERDVGVLGAVDVNADGTSDILDLAWGGSQQAFFGFYENAGGGNFEDRMVFATESQVDTSTSSGLRPLNYIVADVNGDTRTDLIVIGYVFADDALSLAVFTGNSSGGFDLPTSVLALPDALYTGGNIFDIDSKDMATGDFDSDGDMDLAITSTTDFIQLFTNDGLGNFTAASQLPVGRRPLHISAADFNGDGFLDLVTLNQDSQTLHISFGFGNGIFGSADTSPDDYVSIPLDSDVNLYDMVVADFDGNGLPDIAFAESALETAENSNGNGSVQIFLNPAQ